jgi:hypothetical protein
VVARRTIASKADGFAIDSDEGRSLDHLWYQVRTGTMRLNRVVDANNERTVNGDKVIAAAQLLTAG